VLQCDEIADLHGWRKVGDSEIVAAHIVDADGNADHFIRNVATAGGCHHGKRTARPWVPALSDLDILSWTLVR